jgi:hypothetical protein
VPKNASAVVVEKNSKRIFWSARLRASKRDTGDQTRWEERKSFFKVPLFFWIFDESR